MPSFCVVLVEPKYGGNIGSVARCMKNFGVKDLIMVNPCEIDDTAYMMAMHARDILENSRIFPDLESALNEIDLAVATTSVIEEHRKACLRKAYTLREFVEDVRDFGGKVGLIFGREDYGLYNHEIKECDILLTIPTSKEYPSLNLSHAVGIVLYELFSSKFDRRVRDRNIGTVEKRRMMETLRDILDHLEYPDHKRGKAEITLRRVIGRAKLTELEYHLLMGILGMIKERIR